MAENTRLLDLFSKVSNKTITTAVPTPSLNLHKNSRVLLVDMMNVFMRSFSATSTHNGYATHVGGIVGSLSSIASIVKLWRPTKVILCFDGEQGSRNRKYLYRGYKANRDTGKINNAKVFSSKQEEEGSKNDQITRLIDYLSCLPVTMIVSDYLEADDIISHLTRRITKVYKDSRVCIFSTDGDYLQLVNDRVTVYNPNPSKRKFYDEQEVLKDYNIHPVNFGLTKALCGDTSDNIPGVTGLGEPTAVKLFEGLNKPKKLLLEDIYQICKDKPRKSVLYDRILYVKNAIETYYQIVNLQDINISDREAEYVEKLFDGPIPHLDRAAFMEMWKDDRMFDAIPNVHTWLETFSGVGKYKDTPKEEQGDFEEA